MVRRKLSICLKNKVILYVLTRYIVYIVQFIALLLVANKLGPYEYGRWGFFLLIYGYFTVVNFGIPHSLNVLMVQHKTDGSRTKDYVKSSFAILVAMAFIVFFVAVMYLISPLSVFSKYNVGVLFYVVCFLAILNYGNSVFTTIYRVKNRLLELSINQSLIPLFIFISSLLFVGDTLFYVLVSAYVIAQITSFIMYLMKGAIPFGGHVRIIYVSEIFKKGFFLFLYNSCFYLILTTTSSIVSYYYTVEEYGLYTFSYSLGHSVLLLLEAFTYIIFPKIIDKFYTGTLSEVKIELNTIRVNYVVLSHGLMYIAFSFFPLFISFFPQYQAALPAICFTALAVLLSTNAFGYNGYLIAKNEEKRIALISLISLIVNVVVGVLVSSLGCPFYYVVICMMFSYIFFTCLCYIRATRILGDKLYFFKLINSIFPVGLLIPYIVGLTIIVFEAYQLAFIPFVIYCILNVSNIRIIALTIKKVIVRPNIVDIS